MPTGAERYYHLAANLLRSYRYHSKYQYPFAIICDRKNKLTVEFDDVVILNQPSNSYNDKLRIFEVTPYNETIFIDADSLAYGDLNAWWEMFEQMSDFCVFGYSYYDLSETRGWFCAKGIGEFADRVRFIPTFNGGVYYLRKTDKCAEIFRLAQHFATHYDSYAFNGFSKPADEPVLALAMAVYGCEPLCRNELVFAPRPYQVALDINKGVAKSKLNGQKYRLVHWSNYYTLKSAYRFEVGCLNSAISGWSWISRLLYKHKVSKAYLWICNIRALVLRVNKKLLKTFKDNS